MPKPPKPSKSPKPAKSKPGGRRLKWLLFAGIAIAALLYWLAHSGVDEKNPLKPGERYQVEKTGAGVNIDYSVLSRKLHAAVDQALAGQKLQAKDVKEAQRSANRTTAEGGVIRWHARHILTGAPADLPADTVAKAIATVVKNAGGELLASEPDEYQGAPAVRLDIGFRDTLGGEPLVITTDRVYITREKTGPSYPADTGKPGVKAKGELAIIIDDFGYNQEPIEAFVNLNRPLTFAVLPYRPYSNEAASRALAAGQQVILHLPMEPLSEKEESEAITVAVNMGDEEIQRIVAKAVTAVPGIIGVNNHQGSRATADRRVMRDTLGILKRQNLFFIDSRTNGQSIGADTARQMGVLSGENELFLDNSSDAAQIKKQLSTAGDLALKYGAATVIGHARLTTATALREALPDLEKRGIRLVFVSKLVK